MQPSLFEHLTPCGHCGAQPIYEKTGVGHQIYCPECRGRARAEYEEGNKSWWVVTFPWSSLGDAVAEWDRACAYHREKACEVGSSGGI